MNNANWILVNGKSRTDYSTFPFAFRQAYFLIEAVKKAKRPALELMKSLKILGPPNLRGERTTYSWHTASEMAKNMGLLELDDHINNKNMKFDRLMK